MKSFFLCLLAACTTATRAQTVVFEKMRCLPTNTTMMSFWADADTKLGFVKQTGRILNQQQHLQLTDSANLPLEYLDRSNGFSPPKANFKDKDSTRFHFYLDLYEIDPATYFARSKNYPPDSNLVKRTSAVFLFIAWLIKGNGAVVFNESLTVTVSIGQTPGMGIPYGNGISYGNFAVTPKAFIEFLKTSLNILLNPKNEMAQVEMKVLPAFFADNFILAKIMNQPKIMVNTVKGISSYTWQDKPEMIRLGDAVYEEIRIKGKNTLKYPDELSNTIRNTEHFSGSDYVFLKQDCRDVINDKNYELRMPVQLDPNDPHRGDLLMFTDFLPGSLHCLLLEKDTIAQFNIEKNQPATDKKIFSNRLSNGIDSSSVFQMGIQNPVWDITYNYVISGKIQQHRFSIYCSGYRNTIKEIYLDDRLVCLAQGKFSPEKFVVFDASLTSGLLNPLLMIGFNRFFE